MCGFCIVFKYLVNIYNKIKCCNRYRYVMFLVSESCEMFSSLSVKPTEFFSRNTDRRYVSVKNNKEINTNNDQILYF